MRKRKSNLTTDYRKHSAEKIMPEFCKNIRLRRMELGMTQGELAEIIGAATARISQIESGTFPIDPNRIIALADALDVTIDWLFRNKPEG